MTTFKKLFQCMAHLGFNGTMRTRKQLNYCRLFLYFEHNFYKISQGILFKRFLKKCSEDENIPLENEIQRQNSQ